MHKKDVNKSDLVRKFLIENPNKNKKDIGRLLFEKYPEHFKDAEDGRDKVRYVTGAKGGNQQKMITDPEKRKFFYNGFETWAKENFNYEERPWDKPYKIPNFKVLNVIADLHSIHLDIPTLKAFLKNTKDKTALLINGDLLDSESLSRHLKGHNMIEYERELEICYNLLKGFKEEFNEVFFHEGNHDFWLERYLLTNAREIFRLRGIGLKELLKLGELKVNHIHNLSYMTFGDLDILHGHQFPGWGGGKFPSVNILDRWQTFKGKYDVKVMASHSHRNDHSISRKSKDGKFGQAWVTPAMCRKGAQYNPYAGWDTGWVELTNNDNVIDVKVHIHG